MGLFGKAKPKRIVVKMPKPIVVKMYGPGGFVGLLNPFVTAVMVARGSWREPEVELIEKDTQEMAKQGYRMVSSQQYKLPLLGIAYQEVTYELVDAPE